jgi:DNA-binding transcriptional ArsR family regulator
MAFTHIEESELPHKHGEMHCHVLDEMPDKESFATVADVFRLLGDPSRCRIFWLLCHCTECVSNIAFITGMTSPAVSHHLKFLKSAGLIISERRGKEVYYTASPDTLPQALHRIIEDVVEITCPEEN